EGTSWSDLQFPLRDGPKKSCDRRMRTRRKCTIVHGGTVRGSSSGRHPWCCCQPGTREAEGHEKVPTSHLSRLLSFTCSVRRGAVLARFRRGRCCVGLLDGGRHFGE